MNNDNMSIHFQRSKLCRLECPNSKLHTYPNGNQWHSQYGAAKYLSKIGKISEKKREKEGKKSGKKPEKEENSGRKGRNWEGSFTLPLLTDRADYAADGNRRIFLLFKPKVKVVSFLALLQ